MDGFMELPSDLPATPNFTLRFERQAWTRVPVKPVRWTSRGELRLERQYRGR
jgi:hypothetical protein